MWPSWIPSGRWIFQDYDLKWYIALRKPLDIWIGGRFTHWSPFGGTQDLLELCQMMNKNITLPICEAWQESLFQKP